MNNEAEYKALINSLEMTMAIGVQKWNVFYDSQLVSFQMSGECEARGEMMIKYQQVTKNLLQRFEQVYMSRFPEQRTHRRMH